MRARVAIVTMAVGLPLTIACGKQISVRPEADASSAPSPSFVTYTSPVPTSVEAGAKHGDDDDVPEPAIPSPLATTCKGVSLVIVEVKVDPSRSAVDPVVELRNASSEHVPLMLPGDGSTSQRRNPTLSYEVTPHDVTPLAGCGNMNSLSPKEIIFLGPGEKTKLGWSFLTEAPSHRGRYALRATYRNDPTSNDLGDNMPGPRTDKLVARVRKTVACTLVSNTVTFDW
jgi:hypothetical protein